MNDDRIASSVNRVFYSDGLGLGRDNPIALKTDNLHIYRKTGMNQIADIVNTGYVRAKEKVRGGHHKEVFWSLGGDKLFYYDKTPVLEIEVDKLEDHQVGAVNLYDLSAIYIFDEMRGEYVNRLEILKMLYEEKYNMTMSNYEEEPNKSTLHF